MLDPGGPMTKKIVKVVENIIYSFLGYAPLQSISYC